MANARIRAHAFGALTSHVFAALRIVALVFCAHRTLVVRRVFLASTTLVARAVHHIFAALVVVAVSVFAHRVSVVGDVVLDGAAGVA